MAFLAVLLPPLALALAQQPGEPPFACVLPEGYGAFAPVPGQPEAWESLQRGGGARLLVQRFKLDASGARADAVLQSLRRQAWGTAALLLEGVSFTAWDGSGWGGVPETAGHTVRYQFEGRALAMVERIAVVGDQLVHFLWEGPAAELPSGLDAAASVRIPDAWIPPPPPDRDLHRGLAPGSEARALPWALEVRLDFVSQREQGDLLVAVRALPTAPGEALPEDLSWVLPEGAADLGADAEGFRRYRLTGSGDPYQPLIRWGLRYSMQADLAALDARWLAVPERPAGRWLPPAWTIDARHPGHLSMLGPAGGTHTASLGAEGGRTTIGPIPAGRCWPMFVSGRFQKRQTSGVTWHLRLDAKAIVADEAVATLHRLMTAADQWLGAPADSAWTVVSFPGVGDRVYPGLFVLDEDREWFQQPADGRLGAFSRRAWLARLAASSRFGTRLRGSGSGAAVLENALAEWSAARLLDAAGYTAAAQELRAIWDEAERAAGPLPTPLSLMPAEEVQAGARLLSGGGRFWQALAAEVGSERLDQVLRAFCDAGAPWTTQQLERALAGDDAQRGERLRVYFDAYLYGIRKP